MADDKIIYKDLSYEIVGILMKVHNELGRFRNEKEYCDRIEYYLKLGQIKYFREKVVPVSFEGERPGRNKEDFEIEDKVILEVKVSRIVERNCYYQVRRYLSASNKKLGILVNFREKYLKPKRILNSLAKEEN
jgi:GxxExxY protein